MIIPNVYDARPDRESATVDMTKFVSEIAKESTVVAIDGLGLGATKKLLTTSLKANDVLLIMGAGDITNLAGAMVQE
jgi:UDP-N-acetylmuramate-alanine ligase